LYECSQQSDDVTTFAIDPDSGRLTERSRVEFALAGVVNFATNAE
jgi:6-phosphogluconolactonase (cycloisomerase 2 family)